MNKVKKILTTLMAATLTVSTGLTSMPMFAHNVKAESKAETISSDTNDMSQYKKINGISSPVDLEEILESQFNSFKIALISGATVNKSGIKREIHAQVSNANKELILIKK